MYVSHLTLHNFRSYADLDLDLPAGVVAFIGRNGQGKTNLIEAIDYLSQLSSHRVASDTPLVKLGADQAVVRAAVVRSERTAILEIEINPGKANTARINRSPTRTREFVGLVKTVVFAPGDLALVQGDPSERRRFLDDLLVMRTPRLAGVRSDYDRVLKQRNSLLKSIGVARRSGASFEAALATLSIWDDQLVDIGAEIRAQRVALIDALQPRVKESYAALAEGVVRDDALLRYQPTGDQTARTAEDFRMSMRAELEARQRDEMDRGVTLTGPHRDELMISIGEFPVKGYASHGESWSAALALRLAAYRLLHDDGDDPILILDDVFAELDAIRRTQVATLIGGAEQVFVTAAAEEDIPQTLGGSWWRVSAGNVTRDE